MRMGNSVNSVIQEKIFTLRKSHAIL